MTPKQSLVDATLSTLGNLDALSRLHDSILKFSDGYCLFDANKQLAAYSDNFLTLYPAIGDDFKLGISYEAYLRLLHRTSAVKNLPEISDIEDWTASQVESLSCAQKLNLHQLHDDRWLRIRHYPLETGETLFIAYDVTQVQQQRQALVENQEKLQAFATLACDWFWELDADLAYTHHSSHRPPPAGIHLEDLIGRQRISTMSDFVVRDAEYTKHNLGLLAHDSIDVVLTWIDAQQRKIYSRIKAEPRRGADGVFAGYIGAGIDVTEQMVLKEQLERHARIDYVTKTLNKRAFETALNDTLSLCRTQDAPYTLGLIDLDNFKCVNDTSGHAAGDDLLKKLKPIFTRHLGESSVIGRIGGDEFGVIFSSDTQDAARRLSQLLVNLSSTNFEWGSHDHKIGASVGIVLLDGEKSSTEMLAIADAACYTAKENGKGNVVIHNEDVKLSSAAIHESGAPSGVAPDPSESPFVLILIDHFTTHEKNISHLIGQTLSEQGIGCMTYLIDHALPNHNLEKTLTALRMVSTNTNCSGVVVLSNSSHFRSEINDLKKLIKLFDGLPMVSVGTGLQEISTVAIDNKTGMQAIMNHLLATPKNKRFCFIQGLPGQVDCVEREQVFRDVLGEHGIQVNEDYILQGNFSIADSYDAVSKLLKQDSAIDVIVSANDVMAVSAIRAVTDKGLNVPQDIVVTGFDGSHHAINSKPALTTAHVSHSSIAKSAAESLLAQMAGDTESLDTIIPANLITRQSSGNIHAGNDAALEQVTGTAILEELSSALSQPALIGLLQSKSSDRSLSDLFMDCYHHGDSGFSAALDAVTVTARTYKSTHPMTTLLQLITRLIDCEDSSEKTINANRALIDAQEKLQNLVSQLHQAEQFDKLRDAQLRERFKLHLSRCNDADSLPGIIDAGFSAIGIRDAFIWLFNDANDLSVDQNTGLVYSCIDGRAQNNLIDQDSIGYLPVKFRKIINNRHFVKKPLHAHGHLYGYLLLIQSSTAPNLLHELAHCISDTIFKIQLNTENQLHAQRMQDINSELRKISRYDAATGFANRPLFLSELTLITEDCIRISGKLSVVQFEINGFKALQETLNHEDGDYILRAMAIRMSECVNGFHQFGRLGDSSFALVLKDVENTSELITNALSAVNQPYELHNKKILLRICAGISVFPKDGNTSQVLLHKSGTALQQATQRGDNTVVTYDPNEDTSVVNMWQIDQDMRIGIDNNEFYLHYQPRVNPVTGEIKSFEALLRWDKETPDGVESIGPNVFIPIAEQSGFITTLGRFALTEACKQVRQWHDEGLDTKVSVNLSAKELDQHDLVARIQSTLAEFNLPVTALELEITESAAIADIADSIEKLKSLQRLGIEVAIDDFGAEHSSLNYLKELPASHLKLDRCFIKDIKEATGGDCADAAIVRAVIALGHSLGFKIVAEGIETEEQWDYLTSLEVDEIQGYFFSRPVGMLQATQLLHDYRVPAKRIA